MLNSKWSCARKHRNRYWETKGKMIIIPQHVSCFLVYSTSRFLTFDNKYCCSTKTANPNNYICSPKAYTRKSIFDIPATPSLLRCSIALIHYTLRSLSHSPLSPETHFFFLLWLPHNFFALYFYRCLLAINTNEISLLNSILLVHLQLWPNFPTREADWTFHYLMDGSKHSYRTGLTISIIIESTA